MERLAQQSKGMAHQRSKEKRESLIAYVTKILREESDDEVVESIAEIVRDVKQNAGVKGGLKSLHKNVGPLIQNALKPETAGVEVEKTSPPVVRQEQGKPRLESRLDHEVHPMHNELILKKIFDYSSVNGLKNCRLVSTKWRDLSLTAWRGKAVIDMDKLTPADFEKVVKEGSEFRGTPFKSYKICFSLYYDYACAKKHIWHAFSTNMQYLVIYPNETKTIISALSNLPDLRAITFRIDLDDVESNFYEGEEVCVLQNLPPISPELRKISKLELQILVTDNINLEQEVGLLWRKMFDNVPTLKSLRVLYTNACRCMDPDVVEMMSATLRNLMESVSEVREEGEFATLNLEELDIVHTQHQSETYALTRGVVTNILESRLPLQRFGIHLGRNPNPCAITNLLEAHAKTLQYLKCDSDPTTMFLKMNVLKTQWGPYLPLKVLLPNLKEIVFVNGSSVWAFYMLGSLDVPNLETLRIEPKKYFCFKEMGMDHALDLNSNISNFEQYSHSLLRAPFLPNVKNFFYGGPRNFSATELQSLAKAMPSVTDLTISLGDHTFPTVYDLWPRLEALHILSSDKSYQKLDDYDVTGFPFRRGNNDIGECVVRDEKRVSNITNLKELRKFVFETGLDKSFEWPRRPLITDISAVYGFLKLPMLRILKLETFCSFSSDVRRALANHVFEIKLVELKDREDKEGMDTEDSEDSEPESDTDISTCESDDENESDSEASV